MNKLAKNWHELSLIVRITIGLLFGIILGIALPQASAVSMLGTLFVGALKAIAPILVFVLVMSSLAQARSGIGTRFQIVVFLYVLSTLLSAIVAVIASFLFPVTLKLSMTTMDTTPPSGIGDVISSLLESLITNPITALMEANYISILTWSIVLGLALKQTSSIHTKEALQDLSNAVSQVVRWIINLAPFGILGLVFQSVSTSGLGILKDYSRLVLLLVGCMLTVALIVNPVIVAICLHCNPYPLVFRCIKESGLTAFFTRSSAANIPVNMALCEKLGLDKNAYSVSIPLGATINMDGAAITITVMTLAAAHTLGISVDIPTAIVLSVLATVAACGASGVTGGSLLLIPMACSLFGISNHVAMQVVGVGFIIGVIQDSFETAVNSSADVLFTATAEFYHWRKEGRDIKF